MKRLKETYVKNSMVSQRREIKILCKTFRGNPQK